MSMKQRAVWLGLMAALFVTGCGEDPVAPPGGDNGGPIDIIKNCHNGILVNVQKTKQISAAIKKIRQLRILLNSLI